MSILNDKDEVMNIDQNRVAGEIIIGVKSKRVEFFFRVQATVRFYESKSSVWENFLRD